MDKMDLGTWLAERVITEDNGIEKVIAIYPGRFQPFGMHHKASYDWLAKQFGKENTFIATADNVNKAGKIKDKSPFTFAQKKQIMVAMGVPADKIIETNPYQPNEITGKYINSDGTSATAAVFAVGDKDMSEDPRFQIKKLKSGKDSYFQSYEPNKDNMQDLILHGYLAVIPHQKIDIPGYDGEMSGTALRQVFATADPNRFKDITGISDPKVYAMVQKVLASDSIRSEQILRFIESYDIKPILMEASETAPGDHDVDDGPRYFYGNNKSYESTTAAIAKRLGYTVLNYLNNNKEIPKYDTKFPDGPPPAVSFFPVGIDGALASGTNYFKELKGKPAYDKWKSYISNVAQQVGYKFLNFLGAEDSIESSAKEPIKPIKVTPKVINKDPVAMGESVTNKEWWNEQLNSILQEQAISQDILSSFEIQDSLNQVIWGDDATLKREVHKKLLTIAVNFFNELKLPSSVKLQDITLTGSIANYNWSKFSDIDLHLRLDFSDISNDTDFVRNYFLAKKNVWNQKHDIMLYGYPVEVYVENIGEPHTASGLYSILNDRWINMPNTAEVEIDKVSIRTKAKSYIDMANELDTLYGEGKYQEIISMVDIIKSKLKNMRSAGLEDNGEYSVENLAFKVLRRNGFIERINNLSTKAYDTSLGMGGEFNLTESKLLTEGGAAGHMAHPFDDNDLTFKDLKELVRRSLAGELDLESAISEKTDGQNLQVTFKDGQVGAARNKSTVINPMSVDQVKEKFKGRGDIENAFVYAMQDLEKAILAIPEAQREKIFGNGRRFVNLEIIYPATQNVISYGPAAYLQFHGMDEFDDTGNKIKSYPDQGSTLQKIITKVNADTQEHFKIIPPNIIQMQKDINFDEKVPYYIDKITRLQREYGLSDKDELAKYHKEWWVKFIDENLPELPEEVKEGLTRRWSAGDKSFRLNSTTISDATMLAKIIEIDKTKSIALGKDNIKKFEEIFLELGADVLYNITNYLAVNPSESVKSLRRDVLRAIEAVKASDDIEVLNKLQIQLQRIEKLGGFDKIVPSEGIVFVYKGKTYKYTGAFAPINALMGIIRYDR
jgi:hypothetical protein